MSDSRMLLEKFNWTDCFCFVSAGTAVIDQQIADATLAGTLYPEESIRCRELVVLLDNSLVENFRKRLNETRSGCNATQNNPTEPEIGQMDAPCDDMESSLTTIDPDSMTNVYFETTIESTEPEIPPVNANEVSESSSILPEMEQFENISEDDSSTEFSTTSEYSSDGNGPLTFNKEIELRRLAEKEGIPWADYDAVDRLVLNPHDLDANEMELYNMATRTWAAIELYQETRHDCAQRVYFTERRISDMFGLDFNQYLGVIRYPQSKKFTVGLMPGHYARLNNILLNELKSLRQNRQYQQWYAMYYDQNESINCFTKSPEKHNGPLIFYFLRLIGMRL